MATTVRRAPPAPPLPTVPTVEAWRAMTPDERMRFQVEVNAALTAAAELMSEGVPHKRAKARTIDALGLHFKTIGRAIYLAEELSVLYPGQKPFTPDILAVLDVAQPEDDERMAWVVADEGKGLDLVIEVLYRGDRDKDLVENVERYAHLGISEYFVYDRARQQVHGFRLPSPGAGRYQRIMPQLGHLRSAVLGLDLAIIGNTLRFLAGEAPLPISADLIERLQGMVESLETKAAEAQAEAQRSQAEAQRSQAEVQRSQADAQHDRARAEQAIAGLRNALLAFLDARGLPCPDDAHARIQACDDPVTLQRWVSRATTAGTTGEVFAEAPPTA
jgi:Uma2 family endonuclease